MFALLITITNDILNSDPKADVLENNLLLKYDPLSY